MRFDYLPQEVEPLPGESGLQVIYDPIITVRVIGPERAYLIPCLIDTGSPETLLPLHFMERLGVPRRERYQLTGANAMAFSAWIGAVDLELRKGGTAHRWSARVGFTHRRDYGLLGHASFLNHFTATFNGLLHRVTLRHNGTFPAPVMSIR